MREKLERSDVNDDAGRNADRAIEALKAGTDFYMEPHTPETVKSYVGDLLANLMHLCKREGVNFNSCMTMAAIHFNDEK